LRNRAYKQTNLLTPTKPSPPWRR